MAFSRWLTTMIPYWPTHAHLPLRPYLKSRTGESMQGKMVVHVNRVHWKSLNPAMRGSSHHLTSDFWAASQKRQEWLDRPFTFCTHTHTHTRIYSYHHPSSIIDRCLRVCVVLWGIKTTHPPPPDRAGQLPRNASALRPTGFCCWCCCLFFAALA